MKLLEMITGPWAIAPEMLAEIQAIYATHLRGEKIDLAAIEARLGRPLASEQQEYTVEPGGVAVLRLSGVMSPKANLFMQISGGISTQLATRQLESAAADARVRATVLAMDTPGGNVIGVPEFADAIRTLSADKPIVLHSDGQLCSAGYWSGSAANAVYISGPVVQVGHIGVVVDRNYNPGATVQQEHITAGKYKRLAKHNEPLGKEARAVVQADVDYVYTLFVDDVARSRGVTAEQVLERMADGRMFRGQQAIDAGLVDGVSTLDALVESLATNPAAYAKRRKAVFAVSSGLPSPSAGAAPRDDPPTREPEGAAMPDPITRASFEQDHAPLYAQIRDEAVAQGAVRERERIQAVLAVGDGLPGHEKLLAGLAYDGKTTAEQAGLAVLAAEKASRAAALAAHASDAPSAVKGSAAPADSKPTAATTAASMVALFNKANGVNSHA